MLDDERKDGSDQIKAMQENIDISKQILSAIYHSVSSIKDQMLQIDSVNLQNSHPNPLNRFGMKCFSQTDEDGITLEIIRRLGIQKGVFAEFGVANGLENNTIVLGGLGWKGFWVGGENLAFDPGPLKRLSYIRDWVTLDNVSRLATIGLKLTKEEHLDIISLDLDGNDIYFVEDLLLNKFTPKLFIVEYNAKFPPPTRFQIQYNSDHKWKYDDYYGAAITNFVDVFNKFGYTLVCCNSHSGANAFFVRNEYMELFRDVPSDIMEIYVPPRYHLYTRFGHAISPQTVATLFLE